MAEAEARLLCPLCEYDVRGLPEPRCPECGHRFEWEELTDPVRAKQRWFFEHRRWLGGYVSTQGRMLWPWRFWRRLRPSHALVGWRLGLFAGMGMLAAGVMIALLTFGLLAQDYQARATALRANLNRPADAGWIRYYAMTGRTLPQGATNAMAESGVTVPALAQAFIDREAPNFGSPASWGEFYGELWPMFRNDKTYPGRLAVLCLAGPLAAVLVLGVMRQSLSRAKVRPGHAMRVAIYSFDPAIVGVPFAAVALLALGRMALFHGEERWVNGLLNVAAFPAAALGFARLEAGVRLYLGVRRSWSVVLACAAVGALLVWVGMLFVYNTWAA